VVCFLTRYRSACAEYNLFPIKSIGIDDWAWRKGQRYGTIVVDLQRGCPIDVLEDRAAETVATWLQSHPDVTIVARDRAEAYASGIRQGAPNATQVADRFHLLKNLASALQEVFSVHHREIDQRNHVPHDEVPDQDDDTGATATAPGVLAGLGQKTTIFWKCLYSLALQRHLIHSRMRLYSRVW
jgi:transposase